MTTKIKSKPRSVKTPRTRNRMAAVKKAMRGINFGFCVYFNTEDGKRMKFGQYVDEVVDTHIKRGAK